MKLIRKNSLPKIGSYSFAGAFSEKDKENVTPLDTEGYILSKYNVIYDCEDGNTIVYNLGSDAISVFSEAEMKYFDNKSIKNAPVELFNAFVTCGYAINEKVDEDLILSIVRQNQIVNIENELKIAINTTYGCNARCDYCFECNADHSKMKNETADKVAEYICRSVNKDTMITYRWFGGEPLLATDIISRIIQKVNEHFSNEIKYRSVILSNGTIYNDEILKHIYGDWNVYEFHVTLDGDKEHHNKKKNFVNKDFDGYTRTIKLIKELTSHGIIVACRLNIDKNNILMLDNIISEFDDFEHKELLNIYVAPVRRHTKKSEEYCFDYSEYGTLFDTVYSVLFEHGLLAKPEILVPKRKVTCCSTRATNEIVVDTKGKLFKCMQTSTDDQHSVGTCEGGLEYNNELAKWLIPKTPDECSECKYFPICQGGCKGFRTLNNPLISPCVIEKYFLDVILKYVYLISKDEDKN